MITPGDSSKIGINWLLEKLQAERVIQEGDEIESDHLDESDDDDNDNTENADHHRTQSVPLSAVSPSLRPRLRVPAERTPLAGYRSSTLNVQANNGGVLSTGPVRVGPDLEEEVQELQSGKMDIKRQQLLRDKVVIEKDMVRNESEVDGQANRQVAEQKEEEAEDGGAEDGEEEAEEEEEDIELADNLSDEQEEYRRFLQTIWDNNEDDDETAEDDDDYEPDESDNDDLAPADRDEDDSNIDEDTVKVNKKELRELVSDCWLAIAGQTIADPDPPARTPDPTQSTATPSNGEPGTQPSSTQSDGQGPTGLESIRNSSSRTVNHSVLSTMVSHLFTGSKLSELCIDGLPVGAIRKIVARQISMAVQLLLQLLLLADDHSQCFSMAYNCLIELSNLRELAVKKAVLMQQNVKNVSALKNVKSDHSRSKMMEVTELQRLMQASAPYVALPSRTSLSTGLSSLPSAGQSMGGEPSHREPSHRLTRSHVVKYNEQSQRSSSLFDVPTLARIGEVLQQTDQAKLVIRQRMQVLTPMTPLPTYFLSQEVPPASNPLSSKTRAVALMQACAERMEAFCQHFRIRMWRVLLPTETHPLKDYPQLLVDPLSAMGRAFFTPSEDDLLLRGIAALGEEDRWNEIRVLFLPSKDSSMLQFRHTQQTMVTNTSGRNAFKRYQQLASESRPGGKGKDDAWTLVEDCFLLKAFEVFGSKWAMFPLFYLPHRKPEEIKNRWMLLLKTWQRAYRQHHLSLPAATLSISPDLHQFLYALHQCHSCHHMQGLVSGVLFDLQTDASPDGEMEVTEEDLSDAQEDSLQDTHTPGSHLMHTSPARPSLEDPGEPVGVPRPGLNPYNAYLSTRLASSQLEGETARRPGLSSSSSSSVGSGGYPSRPPAEPLLLPSITACYPMAPSAPPSSGMTAATAAVGSGPPLLPAGASGPYLLHQGPPTPLDVLSASAVSELHAQMIGRPPRALDSHRSGIASREPMDRAASSIREQPLPVSSLTTKRGKSEEETATTRREAKRRRSKGVTIAAPPVLSTESVSALPLNTSAAMTGRPSIGPCALPVDPGASTLAGLSMPPPTFPSSGEMSFGPFGESELSVGFTNFSRLASIFKEDTDTKTTDLFSELLTASTLPGSTGRSGPDTNTSTDTSQAPTSGLFASVMGRSGGNGSSSM